MNSLQDSKWLERLINRVDNVPYLWSEWQPPPPPAPQRVGWHRRCPWCVLIILWLHEHLSCESVCGEIYDWIIVHDCISPWRCFAGYLSSRQIFLLCCQAVQPSGRCNLQWHSASRARVQISVLKPKGPQQMWNCKTTYVQLSRLAYGDLKWCVCVAESEWVRHTVAYSWDNLPCWSESSAPSWKQLEQWRDLWTSASAWSEGGFADEIFINFRQLSHICL